MSKTIHHTPEDTNRLFTDGCSPNEAESCESLDNLEVMSRSNKERKKAYDRNYKQRTYVRKRANELQNANYKKDPKSRLESSKRYARQKPNQVRLNQLKHRARYRGLDFNLTIEDIPLNPVCPVFGTTLTYSPDEKNQRLKASIDRIDNTKGYIKGNVCCMSLAANISKRDLSIKEIENLLNCLKGFDIA